MRFIPWNERLANTVYANYSAKFPEASESNHWCDVAEALVQSYYGTDINDAPIGSDDFDMNLRGEKIDIKAQVCDMKYFGSPRSFFTVRAHFDKEEKKGLTADFYLFCQIDPKTKQIALIGYLPKELIPIVGRFYKKGEMVNTKLKSCYDFYDIVSADIVPISPEIEH